MIMTTTAADDGADHDGFDALLVDPLRYTAFLDFLARHDAAPLLMFHMEVEQFRRLVGSDAALRSHGTQIARKYLARDAPQRLAPAHLPDDERHRALSALGLRRRAVTAGDGGATAESRTRSCPLDALTRAQSCVRAALEREHFRPFVESTDHARLLRRLQEECGPPPPLDELLADSSNREVRSPHTARGPPPRAVHTRTPPSRVARSWC